MRQLLLSIYWATFFTANLFAQAPYRYFNKLTIQDGLSHNKVNCILQDKRGFIWIGTNDGLNRFDGKYFTIFRNHPNDVSSISGNIITDLLEDENEVLWIATADGGLTKYDYRLPPGIQFTQYKHIPGDTTSIPSNIINALLQDEYGYLWMASSGKSVIRFNKKAVTFLIPVSTGTKTALALCAVSNHQLWVGRQGGGLLKINTSTLTYKSDERYNDLYAKLPHVAIGALFCDKENHTWVGSWDNVLYRINNANGEEQVFKTNSDNPYTFTNDEALDFAEDANNNIWIAGRHSGLHIYDKDEKKFYNYQHEASKEGTIAANTINCIFIDKKGIVWLGTDRGISIYNPLQQSFKQVFLPSKTNNLLIYDFYKDEQNGLLIGTNEGLFIQQQEGDSFKHNMVSFKGTPLSVTKIFYDGSANGYPQNINNNFYIGTNYSLFNYNLKTNTANILAGTENDAVMNKIIDSKVVSIIKDTINNHPVLLVSPYGHYIAYYDLVEKKWVSRMDSSKKIIQQFNLKDNLIRKFYKTRHNQIWLATAKFGLGQWDKKPTPTVQYFNNNPAQNKTVTNNNIYDIAEDDKGNLWVSTYGGGLNYFIIKNKQFVHFTESNNLLEGLQTDTKGNVWMISNGNLDKYNPATKSFITYYLPDIEKSGGIRGDIYKDAAGKMYVGGTNFFISFQPELVTDINTLPKCYFTDFKIFNTSFSNLLLNKKLQLQYNQNFFTIEFAAPDFFNGETQYAYKLDGFDKEWIDAGSRNNVIYSNVSDGSYIFKVKSTNKKGNWNMEETSIAITIVPPFWKTWWFYLLSIILITGSAYALYRYRINELLKRQSIRNKIAQDLHDNVGSTLSSISVYSEVAQIYNHQKKSEDLKNALEKISEASGEMISEMSDTVWAINPKNDHMETILQRMESFAKPLLTAKEIKFSFEYEHSITQLNLEMTKRKNFYLIFKEAVNNALKYADCKSLLVTLKLHHHQLILEIKDDGKGFNTTEMKALAAKSLSGNGLINIKRRAIEMKGVCHIESSPGKGTSVNLQFPVP